jgi:hypothetical protein
MAFSLSMTGSRLGWLWRLNQMRKTIVGVVGLVAICCASFVYAEDPKYTIKQVMKGAFAKGGICGKVVNGEATPEEKEKFVEMMTALCQNTPPKGDKEEWVKTCKKLIEEAKAAQKSEGKAKISANCKACHDKHK